MLKTVFSVQKQFTFLNTISGVHMVCKRESNVFTIPFSVELVM